MLKLTKQRSKKAGLPPGTLIHIGDVFIISPNDKGGKLYEPPVKLVKLCAPLTPMQFNDLYCLARPEVHTLSCGVARPTDFDEHAAALAFYDHIRETITPIEQRLRAEMERVLGADWCARWALGLPQYVDVPGQTNVIEILRLWTYAKALTAMSASLPSSMDPILSSRNNCRAAQAV